MAEIKFRDCSDTCINNLKIKLRDLLYDFNIYDSLGVCIKTRIFCKIFWKAYNDCCPLKTKFVPQ